MKAHSLTLLTLAGCLTSSCIYYTDPIPEMPYVPGQALATRNTHTLNTPQPGGSWATTPTTTAPAPVVAPTPKPAQPAKPVAKPEPKKPSTAITEPLDLTKHITPKPIKPAQPDKPLESKPAVTPTPGEKPAPQPEPKTEPKPTPVDPKSITNDGPIPVATPVPGDPTRVYNPLDSSKTIRILDKNGKVYPSGKELKVRGTNFHFYVP